MENTNFEIENTNTNTMVVAQNNALFAMDDDEKMIADLTSRNVTFCSMVATNPKEQAQLFKAMNNPEKRIGDCINMTIHAKDLYCEVVTCTNKETGEATTCPRIVVIDDKGVAYQAVSIGVYSAIRKIIQVFGRPSWKTPIPLTVKQITKGDRKLLTFDVDFK